MPIVGWNTRFHHRGLLPAMGREGGGGGMSAGITSLMAPSSGKGSGQITSYNGQEETSDPG